MSCFWGESGPHEISMSEQRKFPREIPCSPSRSTVTFVTLESACGETVSVANWLIGVDTGGTFTDLIAFDHASGALKRAKVPSVPGDPSLAVIDALEKLFAEGVKPSDIAMIVHGTTVATNALLEGKGVRAGLLITKGFRAVYEARGWSQPRGADLLDTFYQKPPLLVSQYLTEEVVERLDYEGKVVTPLDEGS